MGSGFRYQRIDLYLYGNQVVILRVVILGIKAAEALPGIIGAIISWVLNKAADVVGWVSQNLWALVLGIRGLIYTCMVTK